MHIINKYKRLIVIVILILFMWSFSPLYFSIKIGNLLNSKLFIDRNTTISLPKNWMVSILSSKKSRLVYIDENFILRNKLDIHDITIRFEKKDNRGKVEFPNDKWVNILFKEKKHITHNGKNCIYQIYRTDKSIDYIYIPQKNAVLNFYKYDNTIPIFIDEFCKD